MYTITIETPNAAFHTTGTYDNALEAVEAALGVERCLNPDASGAWVGVKNGNTPAIPLDDYRRFFAPKEG